METIGKDSVTPTIDQNGYIKSINKGLTKREHFAAMAMQGLCASGANDFNTLHVERVAEISVKQADALIEALNK